MKNKTWLPLLMACGMAFFIYVGMKLAELRMPRYAVYEPTSATFHASEGGLTSDEASAKLTYLFDLLRDRYVDTLNLRQLVEDAIPTIIGDLDPHSDYFPAEELQAVNEELEGSFSGVGIQFNIQQDTVMVIQVTSGGPAERVGLMAGDRIVTVDDSTFTGKGINNQRVIKTLRGQKGTTVRLGIRRSTHDELLHYDVVRDDISVESVVAQYMVGDVGYIKVDNFGRNTYDEFFTALIRLKSRGVRGFLIDLRGNGGGFMEVCCQMVNEFLPRGSLIVYTEGVNSPRRDIKADGRGNMQDDPVVVLIDEWSASASEIFSGAIQDNDRGMVVGRRSFGKGLVQQQFELNDGSALRITVSRYHTPSGRCIQKPYEMGEGEDYAMDLANRYERGEFYSADSIHLSDSLRFTTLGGRTVYGGGGIMPDIFVPSDTSYVTPYYNRCINLGLCYAFAFQYSDKNRSHLSSFNSYGALDAHLRSAGLLNEFVRYAEARAGQPDARTLGRSGKALERLIIAYIMRQTQNENYFFRKFNSDDKTYLEGLRLLQEGLAWPGDEAEH